jgi:PAS domain S-box-containing protein
VEWREALGVHFTEHNSLLLTDDELRASSPLRPLASRVPSLRGLLGSRLLGREGSADGFIVVSDRRDGESFTVDDEALLGQLAAFASLALRHLEAVAELEARAAEAEEGRAVLAAIMEYVPEGITVVGGPERRTRLVSRYGRELVGGGDAVLKGRRPAERIEGFRLLSEDGIEAPDEEQPLGRALRGGETVIGEEWCLETMDGREVPILVSAGPIRDPSGSVTGAISVWRDITERKRAEAELIEARERLLRQEKLAFLGALAGGVGHELRNPLGAIKNAAYFLHMALDEPAPEVAEAIDVLDREVEGAVGVISALLDFARADKPESSPCRLDELIDAALSRIPVPDEVEVSVDVSLSPWVETDAGQLTRVLDNLLVNALQAMPEGGKLDIRAARDGDQLALSVSDTGVGIPEESLAQVFEPLFTSKARGIGLGLAIAKALVERNGGTIEVDSHAGRGTTFTVRLPTAESGERS